MISCCVTGRSKEHKATYVALAHTTALLWASPGITLTFITVSDCDRTFYISHRPLMCLSAGGSEKQMMERKARDELKNKVKNKVKSKVNC